MLTLRITPPRLLGRGPAGSESDIAGFYFGQLWRHWRHADQAAAALLAGVAALRPAAIGGMPWRNGWSRREQALVRGGTGGEAHLGMAARKGVHRLLNPGAFPLESNPLKNKRLFARHCLAAGLPVPETFDGDGAALPAWLDRHDAIIAKPNYSSKGVGVVRYARSGGSWHDGAGMLSGGELRERLGRGLAEGLVLQRWLAPHPDLAIVSPGALPTLRVMTCLDERGAAECCAVLLRLGAGSAPVDNFNAGNLVVAIGSDGRMAATFARAGASVAAVTLHPATGIQIAGRPVPDVAAATRLALRAHAAFREGFTVIGWDIGLAADGPVLIEGNWNPGTDVLQLVSGNGLGETRLGALYRHHLAALPAERWRAARPVEREPRRMRG